MNEPERVVFDCNVYFQALISASGPANRLLGKVISGRALLFVSAAVVEELTELLGRQPVRAKYRLTDEKIDDFLTTVGKYSSVITDVPHVFDLRRDPDDAHYVDLAVAAHARLIVSRDKDLLSLRDPATEEGRDFLAQFPQLSIMTPPEALAWIESDRSA